MWALHAGTIEHGIAWDTFETGIFRCADTVGCTGLAVLNIKEIVGWACLIVCREGRSEEEGDEGVFYHLIKYNDYKT